MITPNTPEELAEAHRQICYMRGIDPDAAPKPKVTVMETRRKIEERQYQNSLESDNYELQGMNLTGAYSVDQEKKKQLAEAAKRSQFNKAYKPR